jgi:hypothetical protein
MYLTKPPRGACHLPHPNSTAREEEGSGRQRNECGGRRGWGCPEWFGSRGRTACNVAPAGSCAGESGRRNREPGRRNRGLRSALRCRQAVRRGRRRLERRRTGLPLFVVMRAGGSVRWCREMKAVFNHATRLSKAVEGSMGATLSGDLCVPLEAVHTRTHSLVHLSHPCVCVCVGATSRVDACGGGAPVSTRPGRDAGQAASGPTPWKNERWRERERWRYGVRVC